MKRRVVSIAAWLVATVASILLATAAVGNVGSWGSDQPAALQATTAGAFTIAPSSAPATSVPEPGTSTTAVVPTNAVPSTPAPPASTTTVSPSTTAVPTSTSATSQPPATTRPPAPSTTTTTSTPPQREEYFESRQLIGGWVQLRIDGNDVHLEAAVAEPGFTIDVEHNGPEKVDVEFKSESHDSKLTARVEAGELEIRTEEEREDDD